VNRQVVSDEMEQARQTFHHLLDSATVAELSRPSNGTKWTNGQLLFHMLFGYLIVVRLLVLVRIFARLPDGFSRVFAGALEASTGPFHIINYFGSVGGPRLLGYAGLGRRFDRVVATLVRRLDRESDSELLQGMHYPTSWDPYFTAYMTLADLYRYPTQHFEHHRRQLTLGAAH
jgi:DinB superfamily